MTWFRRRDRLIDDLIRPPIVKYTGHDEALAQRSRLRREQADRVRSEAAQIDTRDDRLARLRLVR